MVGSDCSRIFRLQPVDEHRGDARALSGLPVSFSTIEASVTSSSGVLTGRSGVRRSQISCSTRALRLLHALDHLLARRAAREPVGLRQQRALARDFLDVAGEGVVLPAAARRSAPRSAPPGSVKACCTTLPSMMVSTTSARLACLVNWYSPDLSSSRALSTITPPMKTQGWSITPSRSSSSAMSRGAGRAGC